MAFPEILRDLRKARGMTQEDLASALGVAKSTISMYEQGNRETNREGLESIADYFNVDLNRLLGRTVGQNVEIDLSGLRYPSNVIPLPQMMKVPIIGDIACGEPIYAEERYGDFAEINPGLKCDFALYAKGDSMIDAGIEDGYLVFIRKQDTVENGEIAAVILDDEATLKRVRRIPGGMIMLEACNPDYEPIFIGGEGETRVVRILGKAVAFQGFL